MPTVLGVLQVHQGLGRAVIFEFLPLILVLFDSQLVQLQHAERSLKEILKHIYNYNICFLHLYIPYTYGQQVNNNNYSKLVNFLLCFFYRKDNVAALCRPRFKSQIFMTMSPLLSLGQMIRPNTEGRESVSTISLECPSPLVTYIKTFASTYTISMES